YVFVLLLVRCDPVCYCFPDTPLFRSRSCCIMSPPAAGMGDEGCSCACDPLCSGSGASFLLHDQSAAAASTLVIVKVGNLTELIRSEEHTSELQSRENIVCRLLLEKKK